MAKLILILICLFGYIVFKGISTKVAHQGLWKTPGASKAKKTQASAIHKEQTPNAGLPPPLEKSTQQTVPTVEQKQFDSLADVYKAEDIPTVVDSAPLDVNQLTEQERQQYQITLQQH